MVGIRGLLLIVALTLAVNCKESSNQEITLQKKIISNIQPVEESESQIRALQKYGEPDPKITPRKKIREAQIYYEDNSLNETKLPTKASINDADTIDYDKYSLNEVKYGFPIEAEKHQEELDDMENYFKSETIKTQMEMSDLENNIEFNRTREAKSHDKNVKALVPIANATSLIRKKRETNDEKHYITKSLKNQKLSNPSEEMANSSLCMCHARCSLVDCTAFSVLGSRSNGICLLTQEENFKFQDEKLSVSYIMSKSIL